MSAFADGTPTPPQANSGDTAWILTASALVLLMTPGLSLFYGGMVRTKNVLSTIYQNYVAIGLVGVIWCVIGYSLAFSGDQGGLIGDLGHFMMAGVGQEPSPTFGTTVPHVAFMIFQCMFAVITPALMIGSFAERIRFKAWMGIVCLWSLLVYSPVCHWVWGTGGWIAKLGGLDFAGGLVVHATAGYSALIAAVLYGKRRDFGGHIKPYDGGMVLLGTGLLLFGWFGFNAGSALTAGGLASHAFATTFFAACSAMLGWTVVDIIRRGKPSAVGSAVGAVAGLVIITPAAGFVTLGSALVMGFIGSIVCNLTATFIREKLKLDDSLDVFGCHGMGGTLGAIMTGIFATKSVNPAGQDGLLYGGVELFKANLIGTVSVAAYSIVATVVIFQAVKLFTTLRVSDQEELHGLDVSQHDEFINSNFEPVAGHTNGHAVPPARKVA